MQADQSPLDFELALYLESGREDVARTSPVAAFTSMAAVRAWQARGQEQRRELAALGPRVVLPTLRATARKLTSLADLRGPYRDSMTATCILNAGDLIVAIGEAAAQPLVHGLRDRDANVRALAACFLTIDALAGEAVITPLKELLLNDQDPVVAFAAAGALAAHPSLDQETCTLAIGIIMDTIAQAVPGLAREMGEGATRRS